MNNDRPDISKTYIQADGGLIDESSLPYDETPLGKYQLSLAQALLDAKLPHAKNVMSEGERVYQAVIEKFKKENNIP